MLREQAPSDNDTMVESLAPLILVVDDTEGNRYAVSRVLRGAGMRVNEAKRGDEALRLLEAALPDLVVLDINLPDTTGYEIRRLIKSNPATAAIPVMHVSASYTESADRAFGLEEGADAYLTHPLDPAVFVATVRALLRASHAEAETRRAAEEWQTTFDAISDAIFLVGSDGTIVRCNHAAAELTEQSPDELIGQSWDEVVRLLGLESGGVPLDIGRGAPIRDLEVEVNDRCFSIATDHASGESTPDSFTVCVVSDVTARKASERERETLLEHTEYARRDAEAARREAEAANRAKGDFLAVMSHELRTPLNAIAGFAELISLGLRGPVTEEQLADLEKIRRSQVTLMSLINDLLSFAKLESGSVQYVIRDVPVDDALRTAGDFVEAQTRAKGLDYVRESCGPTLAVRADPDKLQQILLNLLSNAIKFTETGGTITVSCRPRGDCVELRISDTGSGIPDDKLDSIFDPFMQVDQRLARVQQGVGLGLAISRDLARGMGGELTVESELGTGSTFMLSLPSATSSASVG